MSISTSMFFSKPSKSLPTSSSSTQSSLLTKKRKESPFDSGTPLLQPTSACIRTPSFHSGATLPPRKLEGDQTLSFNEGAAPESKIEEQNLETNIDIHSLITKLQTKSSWLETQLSTMKHKYIYLETKLSTMETQSIQLMTRITTMEQSYSIHTSLRHGKHLPGCLQHRLPTLSFLDWIKQIPVTSQHITFVLSEWNTLSHGIKLVLTEFIQSNTEEQRMLFPIHCSKDKPHSLFIFEKHTTSSSHVTSIPTWQKCSVDIWGECIQILHDTFRQQLYHYMMDIHEQEEHVIPEQQQKNKPMISHDQLCDTMIRICSPMSMKQKMEIKSWIFHFLCNVGQPLR
jgi:hypothetical protein